MRKADIVLAILIVLAVVATAVGGLSSDRFTDERTLSFSSHKQPLPPAGGQAGSGGAHLNWTVPANSTAANLTVTVDFSGQAVRGGSATVSVRITTPDGKSQPPVTQSMTIPQGSTNAHLVLNASAVWMATPGDLRDTTSTGHTQVWTRPLQAVVVVQAPTDVPLARYSFTASAVGDVSYYAAD